MPGPAVGSLGNPSRALIDRSVKLRSEIVLTDELSRQRVVLSLKTDRESERADRESILRSSGREGKNGLSTISVNFLFIK